MEGAVNPYAAPAAQLASGYRRCDTCEAEIHAQAEICPKCGVRQRRQVSKTALLLLTFFTGGLGGHKFYLGKNWQGVLYLLFFWTYIPALASLVEFFVYIFTSSERLNEKYTSAPAGVVIAIVVGLFVGVAMLGILAAIAIPAYQDFTHRARAAEMIMAAAPWREAVEQHHAQTGKLPASAAELKEAPGDAGKGRVSLDTGGVLTVTMPPGNAHAGNTIVLRPEIAEGRINWDCTAGTLPPKYRPASCRAK